MSGHQSDQPRRRVRSNLTFPSGWGETPRVTEVFFLDTDDYTFGSDVRTLVWELVADIEPRVRACLPMLPSHLNLTLLPTRLTIPETGHSGVTHSKDWIQLGVNPWDKRGVTAILRSTLQATFAHEANHAARLAILGSDAYDGRIISAAVFEGLATVFQGELTPDRPPWTQYDESVVDEWIQELIDLPLGTDARPWRFNHPDGRRWIVYRAGTRLIEKAKAVTGGLAPDLVGTQTDELLELLDLHGRS